MSAKDGTAMKFFKGVRCSTYLQGARMRQDKKTSLDALGLYRAVAERRPLRPITSFCGKERMWKGVGEVVARPKRVVLLVDASPEWLSCWRLVLETRGPYRVLAAASAAEALEVLGEAPHVYEQGRSVEAMVCELVLRTNELPGMNGNDLVRLAREIAGKDLPVLLYSRSLVGDNAGHFAGGTVFLPKATVSAATLLERLRILVARKRGPKPQGRAFVPAAAALEGAA